ncbi:MAG: beta strand repeat-containing protein [Gemmatimonadaceae bacterium]
MPPARRRTRRRVSLALAYLLLGSVSCDDPVSPDASRVERVEASPGTLSMTVGETRTIAARAVDANGNTVGDRRILWSTQNPVIATVSQSGVVSAVAAGNTQIAASAGGKSALVQVSVSARPVSQVRIEPATVSVQAGATVTLRADPVDATGGSVTDRPVIWATSASTVATVTSTGVVTGITPGAATISATVDGVSGTAVVTVTPVPVASVTVSPATGALIVGQTLQLSATTASAGGQTLTGRVVTWNSSNNATATVSSTGLVSGVSAGSATITATSEGRAGTAQISVTAVPVAAIRLTPTSVTLASGNTTQLTAQALDADNNVLNRTIVWTTDQPAVATVSQSGLVTAVNTGIARITAGVGTVTASATVSVTPVPVASLTVSPASTTLLVTRTQQLTATAFDAQGNTLTGRTITWISGAPSVATVTQTGLVTAVGAGTAVIFAASEGISASASITVGSVNVASVRITPGGGTVQQGQTLQLSAAALDSVGGVIVGKSVGWRSSNEAVATVGSTGRVLGISPGTFTITATIDGVVGSGSYSVSQLPVAAVTLLPGSATLTAGGSVQLTPSLFSASGAPIAVTGRVITWSSSNSSIATVTGSGLVTGVASGTVTITATCEGINGTASISVSAVPVASVTLSPTSASLSVGQQQAITATARDASGGLLTGRPVTWTSDDPTVVSVASTTAASTTITGVAAGSSAIRATIGGVQGTAPVSVALVPIASITVAPAPANVTEGSSVTLVATPRDAAGNPLTGRTIVWSSNNPQVSVDQTGLVTAVINSASLTATIRASAPGGTPFGTATVTVDYAPVANVTLSPSLLTVNVTQTTAFTPTLTNVVGQQLSLAGRTLSWTSLDPSIASVNTAGVITGVAPGGPVGIELRASSPGQSGPPALGTGLVSVSNVPVASVTVTPSTGTVHVGAIYKKTFTAITRDAAGNVLPGRQVVWTSLNQSVATVDPSTGEVTALTVGGPVTIRATSEGVNGTASVTTDLVTGTTASVTPSAATLNPSVNATTTLSATALDSAGNTISGAALGGRTATWSSANGAVATVNATSGVVTAVAAGTATITGAIGGAPGTSLITVIPPVSQVALGISPDTLILTGSLGGTVTVRDAGGAPLSGRTVTLISSNGGVAAVGPASSTSSSSGQVAVTVTGVSAGSATITASSEGVSQGFTVRMLNPVNSVTVAANPDSVIGTGGPVQANATLRDAGNAVLTGRPIIWSSTNTAVATVSSSGLITVAGVGTASITATSEGRTGSVTFRVLAPVATVTVATPGDSVLVAGTLAATATLRDGATPPNTLTGRPIAWTTSNAGVATVSSAGVITGVSTGNVTITATSEGKSNNVAVRVIPAITAIALTPGTDSLIGMGTIALTATATTTGGGGVPGRILTITSSNPAVATATPGSGVTNASGQVPLTITQVSFGSTTLTVSGSGQTATRLMRMLAPVATVSLTSPGDSILGTASLQASATLRDAGGNVLTGRPITWTSTPGTGTASVSSTGLVTGGAPGTVNITATSEGQTSPSLTLRVLAGVATVTVNGPSTLLVGQTSQATAVLRDASNNVLTGRPIVWSSSAPGKASVSTTGLITAVDSGTTIITATVPAESKSGALPLTVSLVPAATVTVAPATAALLTGATQTFTATVRDASGNILTGRQIDWSSSNAAKLTITTGGVATAVDSGTVTITASTSPPSTPVTGTATVTISLVPVNTVTFPSSTEALQLNQPKSVLVTVKDNNGANAVGRACTMSSADPSKVTITPATGTTNSSGQISVSLTGIAMTSGTPVVVTVTCEGKSGTTSVSVS